MAEIDSEDFDAVPETSGESSAESLLRDQYDELAGLAGSLAHEIKNPLSVIRLNIELLAEDMEGVDAPKVRQWRERVATVNNQCQRMERLLNDFLSFARLRNLELKTGNLNDQIRQVLEWFTPKAQQQNVEIKRYLDSDLPMIRMESQTMQAALVNLVKNALEAMPDGGVLTARTRITRLGVALDLIDTGVGMSHKTLLNMFKTFYTNKYGGSGLGLPTAKRIIEAHGGRINVQSSEGRGTQFTLEFPTPPRID